MRLFLTAFVFLLASNAWAVEPHEVLDDPNLEARARLISKDLRCLVCRNENIDSSNAGIAADLRVLVRERLVAGDSNDEVIDYVVDRYGEYVLLRPRLKDNFLLWFAGPMALLIGAVIVFVSFARRRQTDTKNKHLSQKEEARLAALLKDDL